MAVEVRGYSFNIKQRPTNTLILRKRLEMDVNLRMTAWTLRQRERRLSEMVGALSVVHAAYGQAIESLQTPLAARSAQCEALEATAASLMYHVDSYVTPTSPIAHLATGSSRLLYAQSVLEDKLSESVLEFAKLVRAKVGPGGSLDVGTRALGLERCVVSFRYRGLGADFGLTAVQEWRQAVRRHPESVGGLGRRAVNSAPVAPATLGASRRREGRVKGTVLGRRVCSFPTPPLLL